MLPVRSLTSRIYHGLQEGASEPVCWNAQRNQHTKYFRICPWKPSMNRALLRKYSRKNTPYSYWGCSDSKSIVVRPQGEKSREERTQERKSSLRYISTGQTSL